MITQKMRKEFKHHFTRRKLNSNKTDYGKLAIISGSIGLTGAAYLACMAAMRAGAGLVTLAIPASLNEIMEVKLSEIMTLPVKDDGKGILLRDSSTILKALIKKCDAVGIGPGLSRNKETASVIRKVYGSITQPLVLDADGLNAFIGHNDLLVSKRGNVVMTPHSGECDRLFGTSVSGHIGPHTEIALHIAQSYNCVFVLKGPKTVVASPSQEVYVNKTGNAGMATAGVGDCLFGIVVAFLGFGLSLFDAAKYAVFVHGLAGDMAVKKYGEYSLIASDIIEYLPQAFLLLRK